MAEIIRTYQQEVPALRFIGKKYGNEDRANGTFGARWGEWWQNGWFDRVEAMYEGSLTQVYEDGDAYIGLMRGGCEEQPYEYWIGILMPEGAQAPEGFEAIDFPAGKLGVCWIYGEENTHYGHEVQCREKLVEEGMEIASEWCFERYNCPRSTTPDEKGNTILDICFFVR